MPSRPLSRDRAAEVRLHTWAGTHASKVAKHRMSRGAAVAVLALVAPCRSDLVRAVIDRLAAGSPTAADWPPRSVQLSLLESAERVTLGVVQLIGPGGVTVEHVTYADKLGYSRRVLRLRRHGVFIRDFRTVEELAKEVDLATLREGEGLDG
ncbi:MAG: hypothetical protein ACJ73E_03690 [Mycobacteriales bacterium]